MKYEVEQKYRVQDITATERHLRRLGAAVSPPQSQLDRYYAHPARNFAVTDEAFRLRSMGAINRITYKGPRVDTATKTRQEIELPLPEGAEYRTEFSELLAVLGFLPVAEVAKSRRTSHVRWEREVIEVALDDVAEVGEFVELELVAESEQLAAAKQAITSLAAELELTESIRSSYLQLLLDRRSSPAS